MRFRTQGRLLHWSPADPDMEQSKKAVPASHPDISARFVKESALKKRGTFLPDVDMMDISVRQENLNARGNPIMLQLPLVPAYALTVHKTQSLSIKHQVLGCWLLMTERLRDNARLVCNATSVYVCCFGVLRATVRAERSQRVV